jgi:hypothetical protein
MRGYIGNTDFDWYEFLKARSPLEEVNFWLPSGRNMLRIAPEESPGTVLLSCIISGPPPDFPRCGCRQNPRLWGQICVLW